MHLSPRDVDKLLLHNAGFLAQKRLARGLRLNYPEAVALIATQILELIRDGRRVAELMDVGRRILGRAEVLAGVPEMIHEVQVEGTFADGTKLVTVHEPFVLDRGDLALALYGTTTTITPGTVTGELLPNPVTPGSLYPLAMQNVSAVQIQDSDATPKTLPVSQYSVNAKHGSLVVLDATSGGPYTEPFTVDYAYGAAQSTAMFTQPLPERWIRFEGLNTADGNREVVIDLYRVAINPAKELSIITDELLKFELSGQVLADLTKPVGGDLGQFGRLVLL